MTSTWKKCTARVCAALAVASLAGMFIVGNRPGNTAQGVAFQQQVLTADGGAPPPDTLKEDGGAPPPDTLMEDGGAPPPTNPLKPSPSAA
jgi:hypothetical protein